MMRQISPDDAIGLLGGESCAYDLACCLGDRERLCRARSIGSDKFMVCLEKSEDCNFSMHFGGGFMCKCPVRINLANTLGF